MNGASNGILDKLGEIVDHCGVWLMCLRFFGKRGGDYIFSLENGVGDERAKNRL